MIGSIIGDIVGSTYEFNNIKIKDFPFFTKGSDYTDDSILTIATADWLLHGGEIAHYYSNYATIYNHPMGGYGTSFKEWTVRSQRLDDYTPYNSCGNGSAMRIGPVGWAFNTLKEVMHFAEVSAQCTHNHPEGIKGAQSVALCILMARQGVSKQKIRNTIEANFGYDLSLSIDELRPRYSWDGLDNKAYGYGGTCQGSVPQAIRAFIDGDNFEDCIRNAISIGGDSDTISCITGSIAEAFYGVPATIRKQFWDYIPCDMQTVITEFEAKYGNR